MRYLYRTLWKPLDTAFPRQEEDFRVVIWRVGASDPMAIQSDPKVEEKVLELIGDAPSISRAKLSESLNISERQVRKVIERLRNKGILTREGGNSGRWIINR